MATAVRRSSTVDGRDVMPARPKLDLHYTAWRAHLAGGGGERKVISLCFPEPKFKLRGRTARYRPARSAPCAAEKIQNLHYTSSAFEDVRAAYACLLYLKNGLHCLVKSEKKIGRVMLDAFHANRLDSTQLRPVLKPERLGNASGRGYTYDIIKSADTSGRLRVSAFQRYFRKYSPIT